MSEPAAPQLPPDAPAELRALLDRRAAARSSRDWPAADTLREQARGLGWLVRDSPGGQVVTPKPPYDVLPSVRDLPDHRTARDARRCTVALLVDGWPDDVRTCVQALLAHVPEDVVIVLLENGPTGAGDVLHELARQHPGRVQEWHVGQPAGWGQSRQALLDADVARVHVLMDVSTVLEGDALTPLLEALDDDGVAGAGWRGVNVRDGWTSFADAGPGDVEALLGYLFAVRRAAALQVPLPAKARYYRNADLEWSYLLRAAGVGRLVVPSGPDGTGLPVRQERHRGYHDVDPAYRDRESRRTYDRFLSRFRGRDDLRLR